MRMLTGILKAVGHFLAAVLTEGLSLGLMGPKAKPATTDRKRHCD